MNAGLGLHVVAAVLALASSACHGGTRQSSTAPPSAVLTVPEEEDAPMVPQTTLIDVVPVFPGMKLPDNSIRVVVSPGNLQATWDPNAPATFSEMATGSPPEATLRGERGRYLIDPDFTLTPGQRNTVEVLPLDPMLELPHNRSQNDPVEPFDEKMLYVDTTIARNTLLVSWRERYVVMSRFRIAANANALTSLAQQQWEGNGSHRAPLDERRDQAIVVTDEPADFELLVTLVEALHRTTREEARAGRDRVPAFQVRVALRSAVTLPVPAPPPEVLPGVAKQFVGARLRHGAPSVSGRLPPEEIVAVVEARTNYFRRCYLQGLSINPNLEGRVSTRFVIGNDGKTSNVSNGGSDLPSRDTVQCVVRAFSGLEFPEPKSGIVTVVYPILFAPPH